MEYRSISDLILTGKGLDDGGCGGGHVNWHWEGNIELQICFDAFFSTHTRYMQKCPAHVTLRLFYVISVGIWVERIVPHPLDMGMVLGI